MKTLSVIVLAYNDQDTITQCLDSVMKQKGLESIEVELIFIPNGCTDDTERLGLEALDRIPTNFNVKTLSVKEGHRNKALNKGISQAKGKYIIYLNADCFIEPNALSQILASLESGYKLVGCNDIPMPSANLLKESILWNYIKIYSEYEKRSLFPMPNGRCIGFPNGYITSFPENIHSEDNWLGLKTYMEHGYNSLCKAGVVYYTLPDNWTDFIKVNTRWNLGTKQVLKLYPEYSQALNNLEQEYSSKIDKELIKSQTIDSLLNQGFSKETIDEIINIRKVVFKLIEDNSKLFKDKLVHSDGTWESDR